jgi:hypothetical protein
MASGFKSHDYEVKQFEAVGKLGDLGLGFFNDINIPIYKGRFEITFTRNSDNNVISLERFKTGWKQICFKFTCQRKNRNKNFLLKVPIMEYSSEVKLSLINDFIKDNNYFFQFKKWQCIRHLHVTGKALNFDITNPYRSVSNPSWAFVLFQAN